MVCLIVVKFAAAVAVQVVLVDTSGHVPPCMHLSGRTDRRFHSVVSVVEVLCWPLVFQISL